MLEALEAGLLAGLLADLLASLLCPPPSTTDSRDFLAAELSLGSQTGTVGILNTEQHIIGSLFASFKI